MKAPGSPSAGKGTMGTGHRLIKLPPARDAHHFYSVSLVKADHVAILNFKRAMKSNSTMFLEGKIHEQC